MIEREEREKKILEILRNSETLVSGTYLAEFFDVSRQVIVQDIAILKAKNIDIISTNRGYRLLSKGIKKIIKVKHDDSEIRSELNAIVDLGASVEDVFVIHKTYGEIRVKLDIKSRRDVDLLVENINSKLSKPLKNLTDNCHYHTIIAENENIFKEYENFIPVTCDLSKLDDLEKTLHSLKKIKFDLIVNSAGIGYFGLHEEMNVSKIKNMITVNLQAPLVISQYFLRTLKENKGIIINISSVTANKESPLASVYSATKAGLSQFSKSLFEEVRKNDVKVITIYPDMTKTNFYENNTYFECDDDEKAYIKMEDVGNTIEFILNQSENIVFTDITIKPQRHKIKKVKRKE